jgi:hypothetical protein
LTVRRARPGSLYRPIGAAAAQDRCLSGPSALVSRPDLPGKLALRLLEVLVNLLRRKRDVGKRLMILVESDQMHGLAVGPCTIPAKRRARTSFVSPLAGNKFSGRQAARRIRAHPLSLAYCSA